MALAPKKHMPRWQIVLIVVTALLALTSGADWWSPGGDGPPAAFGLLCLLWLSVIIGWIVVGEQRWPGFARLVLRVLTWFGIGYLAGRLIRHHNHPEPQPYLTQPPPQAQPVQGTGYVSPAQRGYRPGHATSHNTYDPYGQYGNANYQPHQFSNANDPDNLLHEQWLAERYAERGQWTEYWKHQAGQARAKSMGY
jgi:hypothetical protein